MTRLSPRTRAYAMLALVMLLWAGNSIVGRAVRGEVPPLTLAFLRWTGALIVLLPFAWRHLARDRAALLAAWKPVLLLGLLGVAGFNAFLYSGLRFTTASNAMLLQAAIPAMVLLFDLLLFRERPGRIALLGVTVSTFGVLLVIAQGQLAKLLALHFGGGDLLILGGVLVWALYTSLLRIKPKVAPLAFLTATFAIGALAMLPLAAHEWAAGEAIHWTPLTAGAILYVAIFPSVIAYLLYNIAVAELGAGRAGQVTTLMPLFGAFLAAAFLGEELHGYHFAGMAAILGGIALTALANRAGANRRAGLPLARARGMGREA